MRHRPTSRQDDEEWEKEMALWGLIDVPPTEDEPIALWQEHEIVVMWWISIPSFLRFNGIVCLGMDPVAVRADLELSGKSYPPEQYHKLKLIARTLAEELNQREQ